MLMIYNQKCYLKLLFTYKTYNQSLMCKYLHRSCLLHLRKHASSKQFNVSQNLTNSGTYAESESVGTHNNFFGIESDEGVIYPENESPSKNLEGINLNLEPKSEFRFVSFGAVRLDSENKPTHYVKQRNVQSSENIRKEQRDNKHDNLYNNLSDHKNPSGNFIGPQINKISQNVTIESKSQLLKSTESENVNDKNNSSLNCKPTENFIENLYFSEHDHSTTLKVENGINLFNHCDPFLNNTEINHIPLNVNKTSSLEREIQNDLSQNAIDSSTKCETAQHNYIDDPIENLLKTKEVAPSYFDKQYFEEEFVKDSVTENDGCSYIEQQYFNENELGFNETLTDLTTSKNSAFIEQHFNKNELELKEKSVEIKKSKANNKTKQIKYKLENENESPKAEHLKPKTNFRSSLTFKNNEIVNGSVNLENQDKINLFVSNSNERIGSNLNSTTTNSKMSQIKVSGKHFGVMTNIKDSKNLENDSEKTSLNVSENSNIEENSETAYDFVQKLREKEKMSDLIKRGISAKKEKKLDSKGFRILKHQVPSLMYFTRDEILELLKDNVLYSDEDIVVLNKPYNLIIHESNTVKDNACLSMYLKDFAQLLDESTTDPELFTVHRLDKETTGCLILARNEMAAQKMKSLFAQRKILKTYWVVTSKVPDPLEGIIDIPISEGRIEKKTRMVLHPDLPADVPYVNHSKVGKRAVTTYSVIATSGNAALVEVKPETGIKHQIRVHFGFGLDCPILGDHKYSHLNKLAPQKLSSDLLQRLKVRQSKVRHIPLHIHSKHVLIPQYSEGRNLFVTAPLPKHMAENLRSLKFKKK